MWGFALLLALAPHSSGSSWSGQPPGSSLSTGSTGFTWFWCLALQSFLALLSVAYVLCAEIGATANRNLSEVVSEARSRDGSGHRSSKSLPLYATPVGGNRRLPKRPARDGACRRQARAEAIEDRTRSASWPVMATTSSTEKPSTAWRMKASRS